MDQKVIQILFILLRSAISGERLTENERKIFLDDISHDLLKISSKHCIANLLVLGLRDNGFIPRNCAETQ